MDEDILDGSGTMGENQCGTSASALAHQRAEGRAKGLTGATRGATAKKCHESLRVCSAAASKC